MNLCRSLANHQAHDTLIVELELWTEVQAEALPPSCSADIGRDRTPLLAGRDLLYPRTPPRFENEGVLCWYD